MYGLGLRICYKNTHGLANYRNNAASWKGRLTGSTLWLRRFVMSYAGGCQHYGPFLDPYYNAAPNV